jgi:phosphatidylglycerol:prolipoprotein diacylglycerol transferase
MLPRLFTLEGNGLLLHLNGYGFSIFCGTLAALLIAVRRAKSSDLPLRPLLWIIMIGLAGGFAGSKLAFWIQFGRLGGGVLYGGLLGGFAAGLAVSRRFGLAPLTVADLAAPCALLAAAFGRLGCFFAGCCFGTVCDAGLSYPAGSHAWKHQLATGLIGPHSLSSLPTVPAPLLEAAALLVLFFGTSLLDRRSPGRALAACGISYASWRFAAEFWRGDHSPFWGPLTFSQLISLAVLAASVVLRRRRPGTTTPSTGVPHPRFAWAQMGAMLLLVGVATGSVGCNAKERRAAAKDVGDAATECMFDCIGDCINSCIDDCTEKNCNGPAAADPEPRAKTFRERRPKRSPWFTLPPIEPGKSYVGRLSFQGTVNTSEVSFAIGGKFQPGEPGADGSIETRIEVNELDVRLGLFILKSAPGELLLVVDSRKQVTLKNASLSPDTLAILKALEPVGGGFLRVETSERPAQNWRDRVALEMNTPGGKAECWATLTLNEQTHAFRGTATVTRMADGEPRLQWQLFRER